MGMYTEIYVNADLKESTPQEVIDVLKAMTTDSDTLPAALQDRPFRWSYMFYDGSYYTPKTECRHLTHDDISNCWSLLGKGDIKNYEDEIEEFFAFIAPHCEEGFIGYSRYEESWEPTLYFAGEELCNN